MTFRIVGNSSFVSTPCLEAFVAAITKHYPPDGGDSRVVELVFTAIDKPEARKKYHKLEGSERLSSVFWAPWNGEQSKRVWIGIAGPKQIPVLEWMAALVANRMPVRVEHAVAQRFLHLYSWRDLREVPAGAVLDCCATKQGPRVRYKPDTLRLRYVRDNNVVYLRYDHKRVVKRARAVVRYWTRANECARQLGSHNPDAVELWREQHAELEAILAAHLQCKPEGA